MGVLDGGARLAPGVDDGLAVAEPGDVGVLLDPVADGGHDRRRLLVGQHRPRVLVARARGRAPRGCRPRVAWVKTGPRLVTTNGRVALEGRIEVGHHPDQPLAVGTPDLEGGRHALLVAGAEGAGSGGVGLDRGDPGREGLGPGGPVGAHHHPAAGEGIESELVHREWASASLWSSCLCTHARSPPLFRLRRSSLAGMARRWRKPCH